MIQRELFSSSVLAEVESSEESKLATIKAKRDKTMATVIVEDFPSIAELDTDTILGTFSYTQQRVGRRFIVRDEIVQRGEFVYSPPEYTRDWLRVRVGDLLFTKLERSAPVLPAPMFARPCEFRGHVYIDLKSAYWSISRIVGVDCEYSPGSYLAIGTDIADFPLHYHKMARSSLTTMALSSGVPVWHPSKRAISILPMKPVGSLCLWALTMDMLHMIAKHAVTCNAVYYNTDGAILPLERVTEYTRLLKKLNLHYGIKGEGDGVIWAVGGYAIGDIVSLRPRIVAPPFSNVRTRVNPDWLTDAWLRAVEYRLQRR